MEIASRAAGRSCGHWQAVGAMQLVATHAQLTATTGTFGERSLVDSFRSEGHFLEEALIDDNANLETIIKISSSGAQNRRDGFAITTLLEAKRSAAQNGVIHGPLSHLPPPVYPVDSGWLRIVSAAIHHASFEQHMTQRRSPLPRDAGQPFSSANWSYPRPALASPTAMYRVDSSFTHSKPPPITMLLPTLVCSERVAQRLA